MSRCGLFFQEVWRRRRRREKGKSGSRRKTKTSFKITKKRYWVRGEGVRGRERVGEGRTFKKHENLEARATEGQLVYRDWIGGLIYSLNTSVTRKTRHA